MYGRPHNFDIKFHEFFGGFIFLPTSQSHNVDIHINRPQFIIPASVAAMLNGFQTAKDLTPF